VRTWEGFITVLARLAERERADRLLAAGELSHSRAARMVDRSWRVAGVALVLLCLAVYLPGLVALPPVDRDESRFAQASRQMVESGDWVVPKVQDRERLNKPPLVYWVQSASVMLLGDPVDGRNENIWVYRTPSVVCAVLTVLLTWRLGCRLFDPRAAVLGAALLAVCPIVVWDAHQARADQLLLTTVVGTQFAMFMAWRTGKARWVAAVWALVALGVLAKGPITPMIAGLTVLGVCVMTGRWRWVWGLRPVMGLVIVAAVVGPWVYAVGERVGWERYASIVYAETLGRSAEPKEGHWGPPGYHLVLLSVMLWPGSLVTGLAVAGAVRRVRRRRRMGGVWRGRSAAEVFLLAWVVPSWVVFEVVSTKLPHYTMPLYPALALLSARAAFAVQAGVVPSARSLGSRIGFGIWVGIGAVLAVAALGLVVVAPGSMGRTVAAVALAGAGLWLVYLAKRAVDRDRMIVASAAGVGVAVCAAVGLIRVGLPGPMGLSERTAAAVRAVDPAGGRALAIVGYHEDSLIFLTHGRARRVDVEGARAWAEANPFGVAVVRAGDFELAGAGVFAEVEGFNYSIGKHESLRVVEASVIAGRAER
jgi:4-amino-4-deoxy-L-arabinose transferase-like glycosyltransferase